MGTSRTVRILYIDEDVRSARLFQERMSAAGYEVELAHNQEKALALRRKSSHDVLCLDLRPSAGCLEIIRVLASEGKLPLTIVFAAPRDTSVAVEATRRGAFDYIVKDPRFRHLERVPSTIEKGLRAHRLLKGRGATSAAGRREIPSQEARSTALEVENEKLRLAMEELIASRDRYVELYDSAPVGYFTLDQDGLIVEVNRTGAVLLDIRRSNLIRQPFSLFVHDPDKETFQEHYQRVLATRGAHSCSIALMSNDRGVFYARVESVVQLDSHGHVNGCRTVVHDFTELRRVGEALSQGQARFQQIYDSAPVMIHSIDHDGVLRRVNGKWLSEMGYERHEILGRSVENVMTKDSARALHAILPGFWRERKVSDVPYQYVRKDGTVIDVLLDSVVMDDPVWGQVSLSVIQNITERKRAEESLRESEERYRALFDNISNGAAIYRAVGEGEDFVVLDLNRAAEKIIRLRREAIRGKRVLEVFPGIKEFGLFQVLQRVWKSGAAEHYPVKMYQDARVQTWTENFVYKLPSGELVSVFSDETQRVRAEESLRQSEVRYRSIGELIPFGVWVCGADGAVTYLSDSFLEMLGMTFDEAREVKWWDRLQPEDFKRAASKWKRCTETGELWDLEYRVQDKEGTYRTILSRGVPVRNERGEIVSWTGMNLDITDRKRSEEELRKSEERFRTIFEGAADCIHIKDRSLRYTHVNPAMEKLFGLPAAQLIGKTAEELHGEEAGQRMREVDLRVLAGESVEEEHTRPVNGMDLTFHDIRVPLRNSEGVIIGICGFSRNVTERKKVIPTSTLMFREYPSEAMRLAMIQARFAAAKDSIVLLLGESGSGKDHVARWIHKQSRRSSGPFFAVNCAAIPHELAESELFGHERGAFTGAVGRKKGMLELAEGGTLLLNEIGELSLALQSKLLTFLDTKSFLRVGGQKSVQINARVIAATHRNLETEVAGGRFLEALFYRLNVVAIEVPPLRERTEDIPILVEELLRQLATEMQLTEVPMPDEESMSAMARYRWPGNVRELRNVLERSLMLAEGGQLRVVLPLPGSERGEWSHKVLFPENRTLHDVTDEITHRLCEEALRRTRGERNKAARMLGISRDSLYRYMKRFGIKADG